MFTIREAFRLLAKTYIDMVNEEILNKEPSKNSEFVKCEDCQEVYKCNFTSRGGCSNGKKFPPIETDLKK
jgi:hypothetical protein